MYFYWVVLFISFGFRHFLILYADRGLVRNGRPNLGLFSQLYWIVVGSFVTLGFAMAPGKNLLRGNFALQDMNRGKACLLGDMPEHSSKSQAKYKGVALALCVILAVRVTYQRRQLRQFISCLCPNKRMSCLGKFRRNVISLTQTYWWLLWWCVAMTACCLSVDYGQPYLSVRAQFWIWNISGIIGYEGVHFILPFFLDMPVEIERRSSRVKFYVREPVLEPRTLHISTPAETVNTSRFIYTKRHKQQSGARQPAGSPGKAWAIQEFQDARNLPDAQDVPGTSKTLPQNTLGLHGIVGGWQGTRVSNRRLSSLVSIEMPQII